MEEDITVHSGILGNDCGLVKKATKTALHRNDNRRKGPVCSCERMSHDLARRISHSESAVKGVEKDEEENETAMQL